MIELRVLGSLELTQDGAQMLSVLSQPKRAALLCYLAVASATGLRRRDEVLALFWPELDTERARASLRQSLYFLRRSLGETVLVTRGDEEVGVDQAQLWCDAVVFEQRLQAGQRESALELYRGDLLPSFLLEGSPELVDWVDAERTRLRRRAFETAWQLAEAQQSAGVPAAGALWARRALGYAPLEENAVRRCMELLQAAGDAPAALQVFDEYARRLARELEVEPSAQLAGLRASLRGAGARQATVAQVAVAAGDVAPTPAVRTVVLAAPPPPPVRSVAVLPFVSMSANPEDEYFSDGLTDEIVTTLAKIDGLRVASRTSSFAFKGRNMDVREIGQQLNVATLLEGSVQRAGNRLRITTQLVECVDGFHLWSSHWDSSLQDVFAIEDEIASNVGRVLRTLLRQTGEERFPRLPRTNVHAYEHYLRGREFFYQTRKRSLGYARSMFEQAIEADPEYALAHAALAETIALALMYYPAQLADMPTADRASLRALELDPALPEAHAARGSVLFQLKRYEEAEHAFRAAIELEPQLFEAHYFFARMCFETGRTEEAAELFLRACHLRDDYQASFFAAQALAALHRDAEAAAQYEQALRSAATHLDLNPDDARAATMCAVANCRIGHNEEGLAWGRRAIEIDPTDASVRYNVACLHAVAGDSRGAFEQVEAAVRSGFGNRAWLEHDPDLDNIRADPRFQALLAGM